MEVNKNLNLDNFWIPFTPNKAFKLDPRLLVKAKGMYYTSDDNRFFPSKSISNKPH